MGEAGRRSRVPWMVAAGGVTIAALGVTATRALAAAGHPDQNPYAWNQFAIGASASLVGAFIASRRPDHPIGWLLLTAGLMFWVSFAASPGLAWLFAYRPGWETLSRALLAVGISGWIVARGIFLTLVPLAFPDGFGTGSGRRVLRWASTTAIAVTALAHSRVYTPEFFQGQPSTGTAVLAEHLEDWGGKALVLLTFLSIGALLVSALRGDHRSHPGDLVFSLAVALLLVPTVVDGFNNFVQDTSIELSAVEGWTEFALPLVLAFAILRHGTLDIEVVVRRATLYLGLTVVSAAVYLAVVWAVAALRPGSSLATVLGVGAAALTLGLVRHRFQELLNRRLFGARDHPYEVLTALGDQIAAAPASEHALQAVTDTVCDQLRLPFAAADLDLEEARVRVAVTGATAEGAPLERFPLSHQGVALGELLVARRTPDEVMTEGERDLLASLARQAGVLAHNISLVEALRRSRVVLLNAREEERRRIRADLHDGLGPTLATVVMGLEASANRLRDEPELASLLLDLEREMQHAIGDVRALVYDLRPAALDDLGLASAVREHARNLADRSAGTAEPLQMDIDAPDVIRPLPAAVEVAAYRVALEALTNVARHARASSCSVRLHEGDGLEVTVVDDGVGLGEAGRSGIGVQSMRDRVTELGGNFRIESPPGGGTKVTAWFPLAELAAP